MSLPTFRTERLILAPLLPKDTEALVGLDADRAVMRYITGRPRSREEVIANIGRNYTNPTLPPGTGAWAIGLADGPDFIGLAMLKPIEGQAEIEVGYRLHRGYWGAGYAAEAAARLIRHGFETLDLPKILGVVMEGNIGSCRVLERCGLTLCGRISAYGHDDLLRYEISREDYRRANIR